MRRPASPAAAPRAPRRRPKSYVGKLVALAACFACAWAVWHYRDTLFGSAKQVFVPGPIVPLGPTGLEFWATADTELAAGRYNEALENYRKAEARLSDTPARRAAVRCQIGAILYLLGRPAEARKAFEEAIPPESRRGVPETADASNFAATVAQVVLGTIRTDAAEQGIKSDMPPAWALTQFYLGAQALDEGRFADAAKWLGDYAGPRSFDDVKWVLQFQDLARLMAEDLLFAVNAMNDIARARAEGKAGDASQKLNALKAGLRQSERRAFLLSRFGLIEKEIARLVGVFNEDPAIKQQKALAKDRQELERIQKLRGQFAVETSFLPPAEQAAAAAANSYDFDSAAAAFTSVAARMTVPELKQVVADRAALYQRMSALKKAAIETMPKSPYDKPGLANRRGGALAGKAAKADATVITFAQAFGGVSVPWRDLHPQSLLALLAHYGDLAAASQPAERAANYVALAWLARDLKRDRESLAYANAITQLSPDAKSQWDRLTGPLPQPPALPGQEQTAADATLGTFRIPPFMQAGGLSQALSNPNLPSLLDIVPKADAKPKK
ncbi:MAG: tetratricopeptide repeat protein [Verrucomicrobia bacterium]|nr:tetratricopeptide repeat protein [Verrucomicrobiota bacterium]